MRYGVVRRIVLPLGSLFALALAASPAAIAHRVRTDSTTVVRKVAAGPYNLTLDIGPIESMYTMQEAKQQHPKSGEVMVGGSMAMGGMGGPMPNHHLELHVLLRATGKVVTRARVTIAVFNGKGTLIEHLPIAVMYGVREGVGDTHFGNNVALGSGHYRVVVSVERTTASFTFALGGGMSM